MRSPGRFKHGVDLHKKIRVRMSLKNRGKKPKILIIDKKKRPRSPLLTQFYDYITTIFDVKIDERYETPAHKIIQERYGKECPRATSRPYTSRTTRCFIRRKCSGALLNGSTSLTARSTSVPVNLVPLLPYPMFFENIVHRSIHNRIFAFVNCTDINRGCLILGYSFGFSIN